MRVVVLVDGEHYPPVTRWAIQAVISAGDEVLAAVFVGGTEKVAIGALPDLGVPILSSGGDAVQALSDAIARFSPEAVVDLSDEPILGYRERFRLASVALAAGVIYRGADFRLDPPLESAPLAVPTVAVIGAGKRTGKTAIAGHLARLAKAQGLNPVVVAMGRGGPPQPQVAEAGSIDVGALVALVEEGQHAASDYLEDALTTGVTTVGARRAGGGLAGGVFVSNVAEAARLAVERGAGVVILEGSGAALPPVPWDAAAFVAPLDVPEEYLTGYLGPYRLLRSDLVVATMAASSGSGAPIHPPFESYLQREFPDVRLAVTDFEPYPLGEVAGATVFLATTAPKAAAQRHAEHLEAQYGCTVVAMSPHLSDRAELTRDMDTSPTFEILCTELKAAAVDVACRTAIARGASVVFLDNRPVTTGELDIDDELHRLLDLTMHRGAGR